MCVLFNVQSTVKVIIVKDKAHFIEPQVSNIITRCLLHTSQCAGKDNEIERARKAEIGTAESDTLF